MRAADLLAVAAVLVGLGCSGDDRPATAPTVRFEAPASADGTPAEDLALPLTSLLRRSLTDDQLIGRAAHLVVADCMSEQGFDMPPFQAAPYGFPVDHPFGPWGEADIVDGYGLNPGTDEPHDDNALDQFTSALPPTEREAWGVAYRGADPFGGPHTTVTLPDGTEKESGFARGYESGCHFLGFDTVFGGYHERQALRSEIEALVNEAGVDAEDHSDLVDQALDVWHQCMETEGIDVADGGDGPDRLALDFLREPGVSEEERTAAATDIRCKEEANLHDAYFVARAEIEERVIEENQLFVEAWRELVNESLARAREIVAGGGG